MTKPAIIPAQFRVPKVCKHRWIFVVGPFRCEIRGIPGKKQLSMEQFATSAPPDWVMKRADLPSLNLDWIQETVEHLRFICGGED